MSYQIHLNMTVESQNVTIHDLRIQVPEPLPAPHMKKNEEKAEKAEKAERVKKAEEHKYGGDTEYVAASPKYTWDHVPVANKDQYGELLWPIVMASYGLEVTPLKSLSQYSAFHKWSSYPAYKSYPHHTLRDLMEYYIENTIYPLRNIMYGDEKDAFERRKMLRRMVLGRGLVWASEHYDVYCAWSRTLPARPLLNRYQKMVRFVAEFIDPAST